MRALGLAVAFALLVPAGAAAQTPADSAAIRATVTDYIQGWYDTDAPRMERSLHTGLAKRIVVRDPATRRSAVENLTAAELVSNTGSGEKAPANMRRQDITILDIFQNMATVKLVASGWVDYMHLGKIDGQWKIVNVMWDEERAPQRRP
ncbi:MAG TPA: nuclear transport factor 2 family protein [Longimicrobiaceae bacterium]|nr:nuclear transport factor 2 family protein [Longimicrobiaceae bacterium]